MSLLLFFDKTQRELNKKSYRPYVNWCQIFLQYAFFQNHKAKILVEVYHNFPNSGFYTVSRSYSFY